MRKFTPGPWKYTNTHQCSNDAWFVITDAKGYGPIFDVGGKDFNGQVAEAKYLITDKGEIEANARLISAAPELYEALRELAIFHGPIHEEECSQDDTCDCLYKRINDMVENALAKAEGR